MDSFRRRYPTDLTDEEWDLLEPFYQGDHRCGGRNPKYSRREILNAICYLLRTGCQWRLLPSDFPPWQTVYSQFRRWGKTRFFEQANGLLLKKYRELSGKSPRPSAAIVDSQTAKTTEKGGSVGMTGARRLREEKDTYVLILRAHS